MRKSEQVCARVTPEVMTNLRTLAKKHSMLLSEFIRRTLAEKVGTIATGAVGNEDELVPRQSDVPFQ